MDVLCTDKTGTLTQGRIVLKKHLDVHGNPSEKVLHCGYLNSYHHTGLKNLLDEAILKHEELREHLNEIEKNRGIFYDNTVADACLRLFREKGFKLEGT